MTRRAGFLLALLLAAVLAAAPAGAATPRASFNDIEDEVMCVSCNVPLNIAESPQADRERAEIRRLVAQGLTKKEIKDQLVADYGDRVLALPPSHGFNTAAYVVPFLVFAGLLALLAVLVPRWRRRPARIQGLAAVGSPAPALSAEDAARLDDDLRRYD